MNSQTKTLWTRLDRPRWRWYIKINRRREETKAKQSDELQRKLEEYSEPGASNWLGALPLKQYGFDLGKGEFQDALSIRYNKQPKNIPSRCPCGTLQPVANKSGYGATAILTDEARLDIRIFWRQILATNSIKRWPRRFPRRTETNMKTWCVIWGWKSPPLCSKPHFCVSEARGRWRHMSNWEMTSVSVFMNWECRHRERTFLLRQF